jgi:hypothetical protein
MEKAGLWVPNMHAGTGCGAYTGSGSVMYFGPDGGVYTGPGGLEKRIGMRIIYQLRWC